MKTIIYECDYCGDQDEAKVVSGGVIPRKLWQVGHREVCDNCLKDAQNYLKHKHEDEETTIR